MNSDVICPFSLYGILFLCGQRDLSSVFLLEVSLFPLGKVGVSPSSPVLEGLDG